MPTTTAVNSGTTPQRSSTWPATRNPSGAARVFADTAAAITFARSATGVRDVITPRVGPFTNGVKSVARKSAAKTTGHGGRNGRIQSGIAKARIPTAASFSGGTLFTTKIASTLPTTAPAPSAA